MLGDLDSGAGDDESGGGGNVEGAARVAASAASVDEHFIGGPFGVEDWFGVAAHRFGEADEFVNRFTFFAQGCEEADNLLVSGFTGEELVHEDFGFNASEIFGVRNFGEEIGEGFGAGMR